MDREQARDTVKGYLEDYLRGKGIDTRKPFRCLSPDHEDRHPSMSYDRRRQRCKCFSCNVSYDIFDLIGIDYGLTEPADIFNKAYSLYGITIDGRHAADQERRQYPTPKKEDPKQDEPQQENQKPQENQMEYFKKVQAILNSQEGAAGRDYIKRVRGLHEDTAEKFGDYALGYDPDFRTYEVDENDSLHFVSWQVVIIPTGPNSYIARNINKAREPAKKNRYRKKGESCLYHAAALNNAERPVFIVEGEMDALSIIDVGGEAVGLGSTSNYKQLIERVKRKKPVQPLILALDADENGQKTEAQLARELTRLQIPFYRHNPYGTMKDANEALLFDRESFTAEIRAAERMQEEAKSAEKENYLKTSAAAHIEAFRGGIAANANTPAISTGFNYLDTILDGGLYEGLYILGAISSLGKTTLTMQLADQLAQSGQDVLIFSLEMARSELMAKSISRHTYLLADNKTEAKTTRGITAGARYANYSQAEKALIDKAVEQYKEYAQHVFIHEGIGNIGVMQVREIVEQHISITGNKPVIIIDYLQILAPYIDKDHPNRALTDKQSVDKNVLELKRLSRDHKLTVFGISSFNRDSYKTGGGSNRGKVSMTDFKESGAVEYSADVLMGLEFAGAGDKDYDEAQEKRKDPRQIRLVILKNRNGRAWASASFNYYPLFNYFQESTGAFAPATPAIADIFKGMRDQPVT